jgi:hypothetical protein
MERTVENIDDVGRIGMPNEVLGMAQVVEHLLTKAEVHAEPARGERHWERLLRSGALGRTINSLRSELA